LKALGGFFETETLLLDVYSQQRSSDTALCNGRTSFFYILKSTGTKKIYIPNFLCNVLFYSIDKLGIDYQFYEIDDFLEIIKIPKVSKNEKLLYINYFGLKLEYALNLSRIFTSSLILDNTHDLFFNPVNSNCWAFNSYRKSIGVPDGSDIYSPLEDFIYPNFLNNQEYSLEHLTLRKKNIFPEAYNAYLNFESNVKVKEVSASLYSKNVLSRFNFPKARCIRISNYRLLHNNLKVWNRLNKRLLVLSEKSTPFSYPYLSVNRIKHKQLWENGIFVPVLWKKHEDYNLLELNQIIHLPIDHRYNNNDMFRIIETIRGIENAE